MNMGMNKLPMEKRRQILTMLCEGSSMRSISRIVDVSINTVSKLLVEAGEACILIHDENVRQVKASRIQCDEIWSFTYAKAKNAPRAKAAPEWAGDTWTWTALDADTKLIVSFLVGGRDAEYAWEFMNDLQSRLSNRVQLTTDGHSAYMQAVEDACQNLRRCAGLDAGSLQPAPVCWSAQAPCQRVARNGQGFHQPCRAPEPHHAHADAPVHPPHQRFQQEAGQPYPCDLALFRVLQFLPHP
jgi:IS1 family transposase